ncbi:MAG: hypothetical protein JEY71_04005 [Sphaerochaeta sp.]|nr:hypothetical protein [Sphaerochaeta sp.]
MEKLTVWVNFDQKEVDVSSLKKYFESDDRFSFSAERITDHEQAIKRAEQTDILINTFDALGEEEFGRIAKRTKLVIRYGTGYDNVDVSVATAHGIPFGNCAGANASSVAELALIHILNCGRNFIRSHKGGQAGNWPVVFPSTELDGKTIGLVGFGNIAKQLVRMLGCFSVKIVTFDPYLDKETQAFAKDNRVTILNSMKELFEICDIISLHIPMNPMTEKIINKEMFDSAKSGLILVNTCRGGVINEKDLIDALQSKKVRSAGLDVLSVEPPTLDNPLLHMEQVSVSAHMGGSTVESEMRTQKMIYETVGAFVNGNFTSNIINRDQIKNRRLK